MEETGFQWTDDNFYRIHVIYKKSDCKTILRYNLLENIDFSEYYVIHLDYFYENDTWKMEYLSKLTIERLIDLDFQEIPWRKSIKEAIKSFDSIFQN